MKTIVDFLKGKKVYILAGLLALHALVQYLVGDMTFEQFIPYLLGSGMFASMRAAVAKV